MFTVVASATDIILDEDFKRTIGIMIIGDENPNDELHQDDIPAGEHIPFQVTPAQGEDEAHMNYALYSVVKENKQK